MNRFIINHTPTTIAKDLCDQHITKMVLEEAQMLCSAVRTHAPDYAERYGLYKMAYQNHPCSVWVRETRANYTFGLSLLQAMSYEYTERYGKIHKSSRLVTALKYADEFMPEGGLTPHPQCFSGHDQCKTNEPWPVEAYRRFYAVDKLKFARYNKGRNMPNWLHKLKEEQGIWTS